MKFKRFTNTLAQLEQESSRNEMTAILADLLLEITDPDELSTIIYLIRGNIVPSYRSLEFNFSEKLLKKALQKKFPAEKVKELIDDEGDLGLAAEKLHGENAVSESLEILSVRDSLLQLALAEGKESQSVKENIYLELLEKSEAIEARYLTRIIVGKLRLGLSDKSIIDALSVAREGDKSISKKIEFAYGKISDLGLIARIVLLEKKVDLESVEITPGVPLAAKLVERENEEKRIIERMGTALIQKKYDGLRLQIHYVKSGIVLEDEKLFRQSVSGNGTFFASEDTPTVKIYSRNLTDLTEMFPDVVELVKSLNVESIIIDTEAIGYDPGTGELLPFQETIRRKRKFAVTETAKEIPVRVFAFDILYLNGKELLKTGLQGRLKQLEQVLKPVSQTDLVLSETIEVSEVDELSEQFDRYKEAGLEGLIAKDPKSLYLPGTRNYDWIKLKVKAKSELADTVDAVVLGYYFGSGVRSRFGIGALLVGAYHREDDKFYSLAKLGTGIKDEQWVKIKQRLDEIKTDMVPVDVEIDKQVLPDVLCYPEVVVVVEADEVTKSKVHGGGEYHYSLRFPRLKKFDRKDKDPRQINTWKEIEQMFQLNH